MARHKAHAAALMEARVILSTAQDLRRKSKQEAVVATVAIANNMASRWQSFRTGTLKTFLAGILYVVSLPAVRNWLMNLLVGKRKKHQQVIDVDVKK
mgnify:CR=1 FL=1